MSGGHYDYKQYECQQLADMIRRDMDRNGTENEWGERFELTPAMESSMELAAAMLEACDDLVHDIDWALSGDTDPADMPKYITKWLLKHGFEIKDKLKTVEMS